MGKSTYGPVYKRLTFLTAYLLIVRQSVQSTIRVARLDVVQIKLFL